MVRRNVTWQIHEPEVQISIMSSTEVIIIGIVVLILIGPDGLPRLARAVHRLASWYDPSPAERVVLAAIVVTVLGAGLSTLRW